MSRIRLNIDRLVLNGFDPREGKALASALEAQLQQVLANPATRCEWARSHRTPVMKLGRITLEPGPKGSRKFGSGLARAIGTGVNR